MSADENMTAIRRLYQGFDAGNSAVVEELCHPEFELHFAGAPGPLPGAAARQFVEGFLVAFPDVSHQIEDIFASGDKVATRLRVQGTHQGDLQGMPPTGRPMDISSTNIFHFRDGKIVAQWVDLDGLGMMQQLGAIPAPAQAPA